MEEFDYDDPVIFDIDEKERPRTKVCGKCGKEKGIGMFTKNKSKPDGHNYYCKSCSNEYLSKWREKKKEEKMKEKIGKK